MVKLAFPMMGSIDIPNDMVFNTFAWVGFQIFFHCITAMILKPNWPRFAAKDKHIRWGMYNRSVASMHSGVITGMSIYYWMYINTEWDVFQTTELDPFAKRSCDMMMAYLIYDLFHELTFPERADRETLLHHIMGLATHLTARILGSTATCNYFMMIYIAELSTPFLHLCWAMYAMGFKETPMFKVVCVIVLISYFFVRTLWGPFMLWHCYSNGENWAKNPIDYMLYIPNCVVLVIFVLLNWMWFRALVVKFVYLPPDGKKIDYDNDDQLNSKATVSGGKKGGDDKVVENKKKK